MATITSPETGTMTNAMSGATIDRALDPEKEYEIVDGRAEEKIMTGARHGGVGTRLLLHLGWHVARENLGVVYGADTAFEIGANVRIPDGAFIFTARLLRDGEPAGRWSIPPDLAIEVISPSDLFVKMRDKISEYLAAGVKQVWIVDPDAVTITIYRTPTDLTIFAGEEELISEDLLPGFKLRLADVFRLPTNPKDGGANV